MHKSDPEDKNFLKKITQSEQQKERQMKRKKSKATYEISRIPSEQAYNIWFPAGEREGVENVFEHYG